MPRQKQSQRVTPTPFGLWLTHARKARGLSINRFAEAVGVSNAHISKLEAGKANASRDMVRQLAEALSGPGMDERMSAALLREGMTAAGFLVAERPEIEYVPVEEDEAELLKFLRGQPPGMTARARRVLEAMFAEDDAEERAEGRHGGRAE